MVKGLVVGSLKKKEGKKKRMGRRAAVFCKIFRWLYGVCGCDQLKKLMKCGDLDDDTVFFWLVEEISWS